MYYIMLEVRPPVLVKRLDPSQYVHVTYSTGSADGAKEYMYESSYQNYW